jgi:putative transcriptional regulator
MTLPDHHPPHQWLAAYAAGAGDEGVDLLVACHCTLCPSCRALVDDFEAIGGVMLTEAPSVDVDPSALAQVLARLGPQEPKPQAPRAKDAVLPRPLQDYVGPAAEVKWEFVIPGIRQIELPIIHGTMPVRLFKFTPGKQIPLHAHVGIERTLVLQGGYTDEGGSFARGDIGVRDESEAHNQRIDLGEECIALVVTDNKLVPKTLLGKLFSAITGA